MRVVAKPQSVFQFFYRRGGRVFGSSWRNAGTEGFCGRSGISVRFGRCGRSTSGRFGRVRGAVKSGTTGNYDSKRGGGYSGGHARGAPRRRNHCDSRVFA